jgi:hypothetical protein
MLQYMRNEKSAPYIITVFVSLFLSYLAVTTDNLINHDGVYFMDAAKAFIRDGISVSFEVYNWPFYSWFVAVIHQLLWFDHFEQTAHLVNAIFIAATCTMFMRVYYEVTDHQGSLVVAAVLILTLVGINKYRADIMRDFAYWFFFLAGFYSLLSYYKKPKILTAIGWQVLIGFAFLARIEGLAIILLGPLVLLMKNVSLGQRIMQVVALYGLYIVGALVVVIYLLFVDAAPIGFSPGKLLHLGAYININSLFEAFNQDVLKLGTIFKYEGSKDRFYAFLGMLYTFTLMMYVLSKVVGCFSFPYFGLLCYGSLKRYVTLSEHNKIIIYFSSFLFLFFCVYIIKGPVITPRYTTSLVFMLLLLLGQVVERLLPRISNRKNSRLIFAVVILYLLLRTVDSVISTQGDSMTYILNAGHWVKENVDSSAAVYSNYYKAAYYTDRAASEDSSMEFTELMRAVENGSIGTKSYLNIKIEEDKAEMYMQEIGRLLAAKKIERVIEFSNDDNDRAVIYNVVSSAK